jgi:hypothetical protein
MQQFVREVLLLDTLRSRSSWAHVTRSLLDQHRHMLEDLRQETDQAESLVGESETRRVDRYRWRELEFLVSIDRSSFIRCD